MIHKISDKLAAYCIEKNWIESSKFAWCSYAIEKQLETSVFALFILVFAIASNSYVETICFTLVLYIFRSRMGGWHAKSAWSCQMISVGTTVIAVLLIGPAIEKINSLLIFSLNIVLISAMLILRPIYPVQAHFTQKEINANFSRKNQLCLVLSLIQAASWVFVSTKITVYSFLGLIAAVIAVALEYITKFRKERTNYEST